MDIFDFSILKQIVDQMAAAFGKYIFLVLVVGLLSVLILKSINIPKFIARPIAVFATLAAAYYGVGLIS